MKKLTIALLLSVCIAPTGFAATKNTWAPSKVKKACICPCSEEKGCCGDRSQSCTEACAEECSDDCKCPNTKKKYKDECCENNTQSCTEVCIEECSDECPCTDAQQELKWEEIAESNYVSVLVERDGATDTAWKLISDITQKTFKIATFKSVDLNENALQYAVERNDMSDAEWKTEFYKVMSYCQALARVIKQNPSCTGATFTVFANKK